MRVSFLFVPEISDLTVCPKCGAANDPQFRYCLQCGAKLPAPVPSKSLAHAKPSGVDSGIEPPADALLKEPVYTGGHGGETVPEESGEAVNLPAYAVIEKHDLDRRKKAGVVFGPPPNGVLIGFFLIIGAVLPPIGVAVALIWAFNRRYRTAAIPAFAAALVGAALWGWGMWSGARRHMYDEPYAALQTYVKAEDWAMESRGNYLPMVELKIEGFLPPDFPRPGQVEFAIVEHVMGPTGYLVEVRPGSEENAFYRMQSLWADHTGEVRIGSRNGPRFKR